MKKSGKHSIGIWGVSQFPGLFTKGLLNKNPSDRINIALIGCNGRGYHVLRQHLKLDNILCTGICDIDQTLLGEVAGKIEKEFDQKPTLYPDFRKLLDDKELHAVIVGTPDHWHCLQTVWACEAGKHVYVEKPMANSIAECEQMVKAGERYDRIIQVGQQQRSSVVWNDAIQFIKEGKIGKLRKANIWANFNYGLGPLRRPNGPIPDGVDYNMWLGPAPHRSFNPSRFHGSWRFFWDYGGGLMTDWGVHLIDMALWAKDITTPPTEVLAYGTCLEDPERERETFDSMTVVFPYKDYIIQWEHSAGLQHGPYDKLYGVAFIGDKGTLVADRRGWQVFPEWDNEKKAHKIKEIPEQTGQSGHDLHPRDFILAIRNRIDPVCSAKIGRAVAVAAHMANVAVRTGNHRLQWGEEKGKFKSAKSANHLIKPAYRKPWTFPKL